ncbi:SOS response-associated peptidase [Rudanella lutea]|uniref:SOS response-associated peptidase n=1 Tax=Rudanella lutea TaxID=451374 RepID=UPI00037C7C70|nr:SOS response-associated peptidase [Rudanella lutea]
MCYHTSLITDQPALESRFKATLPKGSPLEPVYHASAFGFPAWPILTRQQPEQFRYIRWGLIPRWVRSADDADQIRAKTINARSESIFEKPSFRTAAQQGQRCLIPMTGFYEWHTIGSKKYPFYITTTDTPIFSVAGLWDEWADPESGELVATYTLLTTDANPLLAAIHNTKQRMPCLLTPEAEQAWLHESLDEKQTLELLATAYPASRMHSHSISKRITSRTETSDVPEVLEPANYPELARKPELFAA